MTQKYKLYSLLLAAPLFLLGCSDEEGAVVSSNNKETISINAGIDTRQIGIKTRDLEPKKDGYSAFKKGTQISLRTEGVWKGKTPENVVKISTATTSEGKTKDSGDAEKIFNELSIASTGNPLYWDDFGTADPNNTDSRTAGLTMYGAAVDGLTTGGPTISASDYTISWELDTVQSGTDGWSKKDLLISNNIKNVKDGTDGRYKFENKATAANLIFTHAMSQITVNLYRGDGFTDNEVTEGLATAVTLLNMQTKGTVNVTTGEITNLGTTENNNVTPHQDSFSKDTTKVTNGKQFASYSALVMPTNTFASDKNILTITVNKNTFYVTGKKIIEAAENASTTSHTLKAGTNYIFNIKVSKTGLNITAQIAPWTSYTAAEETPVLNITADRTDTYTGTNNLATSFKLYYSDKAATDYTNSTMFGTEEGTASPVSVTWDNTNSKYTYPALYWPNHTTGYFFRGVVALNNNDNAIAKDNSSVFYPTVVADNGGDYIKLESGNAEKCNVLVGTHANNITGNTGEGALATTGKVRLTFYHKMAHVTVLLRTTTGDDKVNLGTKSEDMPKVEVLSFNKDGQVLLGTGVVTATTTTPADYTMPTLTTTYSSTATDNFYSRASYMVPQQLTSDMKFKVTIKNDDNTTDTYTSVAINTIKVQTGSEDAQAATAWNEGCKYVYTLTLKKTGISVSAVLVPWTEYTGSTEVPFM